MNLVDVRIRPMPTSTTSKMGRPPGKKSDPEFSQITAYIKVDTQNAVKMELLKDATSGKKQDMSELIESLLCGWLKKRTR